MVPGAGVMVPSGVVPGTMVPGREVGSVVSGAGTVGVHLATSCPAARQLPLAPPRQHTLAAVNSQ